MTNFEYINQHFTELDLAYYEFPHAMPLSNQPPRFSDRIYSAFTEWAESCSSNHGNMAKGCKAGNHVIEEDPSIWAWHRWYFPDGEWREAGRNKIVAFQVWLSMQYKPEEWD